MTPLLRLIGSEAIDAVGYPHRGTQGKAGSANSTR